MKDRDSIDFIFSYGGSLLQGIDLVEARSYRTSGYKDLLKNEVFSSSVDVEKILSSLDENFLNVVILNYSFGKVLELEETEDSELFIHLKFKQYQKYEGQSDEDELSLTLKSSPDFSSYKNIFDLGMKNLIDGNCYQLNITQPFSFSFNSFSSLRNNFFAKNTLSQYAHYFFSEEMDLSLLSNSPECLFELKGRTLVTRPIKGTIKDTEPIVKLTHCEKNDAELNIITDLLRNDLSRIGRNNSSVVELKKVFKVPGLYHQFSEIEVELEEVNLFKILKSIYPGGSITGAPKKRVIKILDEIEGYDRSFYTGSTVIWSKQIKQASINIRTAEVKLSDNSFTYGAGGGVTLLSDCQDEYEEMNAKVSSFLKTLE